MSGRSMTIITLSGFGDFSEDKAGYRELKRAAESHGVKFYATYYDHELQGTPEAIEAITKELWGMPRDQWGENALTETPIDPD